MSDEMLPEAAGHAASGLGGGLLTMLVGWLIRKKEKQDDSQDVVLGRIEAKLQDVHTELRLQAERFLALEHQVDALKERINGGLANHGERLQDLTERLVRLETVMELKR